MVLPKYVSLNGIGLRLIGNEYYWDDNKELCVRFLIKNNKLFSIKNKKSNNMYGTELIPITEEEWDLSTKLFFLIIN